MDRPAQNDSNKKESSEKQRKEKLERSDSRAKGGNSHRDRADAANRKGAEPARSDGRRETSGNTERSKTKESSLQRDSTQPISTEQKFERTQVANRANAIAFGFNERTPNPSQVKAWTDKVSLQDRQSLRTGQKQLFVTVKASRPGSTDYNQKLSEDRASSVRNQLAKELNIPKDAIKTQAIGNGDARAQGKGSNIDDRNDRVAELQIIGKNDSPPPKFDVTEGQIHDLVKSLTANLPDYSNPDNIKELKDRGIQVGDAAKNLIKDAAKAAKAEADPKDALKGAVNLVKDVAKPGFDLFANALNDRNAFHNLVGNYVPAYVRGVEKTVAVPSSQPPLIERSGGIGQLGDRKAGLQAVRAGNRDGQDAAKKTSAQDIATLKKVLQETKSARMFEQKLSEELVRRLERRTL